MRKAYISIAALLLCGSVADGADSGQPYGQNDRCRCVGSDACGETSGVQ